MTDIPHLAYPFRWDGTGHARVLEQDTVDEIANCCTVIMKTPKGMRSDLLEFGFEDETFSGKTVDPGKIITALQEWEPRAELAIVSSLVRDLTESNATIRVQAREGFPDPGIQR